MTSLRLVADVGGTNCRLALARDGRPDADSIRSVRNRDHDSFAEAATAYLADAGVTPDELVVAVAGPVTGRTARLTNWKWRFDAAELSDRFGGARVEFLNDLTALGYSVPMLGPDGLLPVVDISAPDDPRRQSLVMGIGTGFNVSPVIQSPGSVVCPRAEMGHVGLPLGVATLLRREIGAVGEGMTTIEDCFSGRGFAALRDAHPGDDAAFHKVYARLMGTLARDMLLAFMPTSGIHFAGGVARAVLSGEAASDFCQTFTQPFALDGAPSAPVSVILDDAAALLGCAQLRIAD